MESGLLLLGVFLFGALASALLVPALTASLGLAFRRAMLRAHVLGAEEGEDGILQGVSLLVRDVCRRGVPPLSPLSRRLLMWQPLAAWLGAFCTALDQRQGSAAIAGKALCEVMVAGLLSIIALVWLITGSLLAAALAAGTLVVILSFRVSRLEREREDRLYAQLPDALDSLGVCFSAGLSIPQSFGQVAAESEEPLASELNTVICDIRAGRSMQEALDALERRSPVSELRFIALALEIQSRTGGSFRPILEGAATSVTQTLDLRRSLSVQTTQARFSARIVILMPLILLLFLSLMDGSYLSGFFTSTAGWVMFLLAVVLELSGILLIRRILAVEVE